jgi:secondary thiamine-phosphate synthase enzyme
VEASRSAIRAARAASHAGLVARAAALRVATRAPIELVDVTGQVQAVVETAGIENGLVNVQTRHTTTGIALNENEALLLGDLRSLLERLAPRGAAYAHDALHLRPDAPPDERPNGHAHAKALLLRAVGDPERGRGAGAARPLAARAVRRAGRAPRA